MHGLVSEFQFGMFVLVVVAENRRREWDFMEGEKVGVLENEELVSGE